MCFDPSSYADSLKLEEPIKYTQSDPLDILLETGSSGCSPSRTPSPRISIRKSPEIEFVLPENIATPSTFSLLVELAVIELGRVEISESKECYFTLQNLSDQDVECDLINTPGSIFRESKRVALKPKETKRVYTSFTPTTTGRDSCIIYARDPISKSELTITFKWYAVLHSYILFESLSHELNFGYCYVDESKNKYAKVERIRLENVSSHDLYISVISNLILQCFFFADKALSIPVVDFLFPKDSCLAIYVALQPNLQGKSGGGESDCRTLVYISFLLF